MKEYDTYTFTHKSNYNEFAPDVQMTFTTHKEENLDEVLDMIARFLVACGYNENVVRARIEEC